MQISELPDLMNLFFCTYEGLIKYRRPLPVSTECDIILKKDKNGAVCCLLGIFNHSLLAVETMTRH